MKKRFLHFKADRSYNLFLNGEFVDFCDKNNSLDVVITASSVTYMYCPISDNNAVVDNGVITIVDNEIKCSSKNVKIVNYGCEHFDIHFVTKSITNVSNCDIVNQKKVTGGMISVTNLHVGVVELWKGGVAICRESFDDIIEVADIENVGGKSIVSLCFKGGMRGVVVLDNELGKIKFRQVADNIDTDNGVLKCLTDMRNMLGIGKVIEYKIDTDEQSEYSVYISKNPVVENDLVVPYAFLLAIQSKDYVIAKKFLADSFGNIQDMQLRGYFGEFESIHYNQYNTDDSIIYVTQGKYCKQYEFLVDGGKIVDIKEQNK